VLGLRRADHRRRCVGLTIDDGQCDNPLGQFVAVSAGSAHSCGVTTEGAIECWGCEGINDDHGQCDDPE
jgi:alpha-tubulin suppressor-like RCC1 family protein